MNKGAQNLAFIVQTGVGVGFYQKGFHFAVEHVVQPEELECEFFALDLGADGAHEVVGNELHLLISVVKLLSCDSRLPEVVSETVITHLCGVFRYFIEVLVLPILGSFLLNGIVGEMDGFVLDVVQRIVRGRSPNIAVSVPVGLEDAIDCCDEQIAPDVEFPVVYSALRHNYRQHFYRYFCTMTVLFELPPFRDSLLSSYFSMSSLVFTTLMPLPRLLFYPGFKIQMFFYWGSSDTIASNLRKSSSAA